MQSFSHPHPDEPESVILDSPNRIYYWSNALRATPAEIREAVKAAGSKSSAVRAALATARRAPPAPLRAA